MSKKRKSRSASDSGIKGISDNTTRRKIRQEFAKKAQMKKIKSLKEDELVQKGIRAKTAKTLRSQIGSSDVSRYQKHRKTEQVKTVRTRAKIRAEQIERITEKVLSKDGDPASEDTPFILKEQVLSYRYKLQPLLKESVEAPIQQQQRQRKEALREYSETLAAWKRKHDELVKTRKAKINNTKHQNYVDKLNEYGLKIFTLLQDRFRNKRSKVMTRTGKRVALHCVPRSDQAAIVAELTELIKRQKNGLTPHPWKNPYHQYLFVQKALERLQQRLYGHLNLLTRSRLFRRRQEAAFRRLEKKPDKSKQRSVLLRLSYKRRYLQGACADAKHFLRDPIFSDMGKQIEAFTNQIKILDSDKEWKKGKGQAKIDHRVAILTPLFKSLLELLKILEGDLRPFRLYIKNVKTLKRSIKAIWLPSIPAQDPNASYRLPAKAARALLSEKFALTRRFVNNRLLDIPGDYKKDFYGPWIDDRAPDVVGRSAAKQAEKVIKKSRETEKDFHDDLLAFFQVKPITLYNFLKGDLRLSPLLNSFKEHVIIKTSSDPKFRALSEKEKKEKISWLEYQHYKNRVLIRNIIRLIRKRLLILLVVKVSSDQGALLGGPPDTTQLSGWLSTMLDAVRQEVIVVAEAATFRGRRPPLDIADLANALKRIDPLVFWFQHASFPEQERISKFVQAHPLFLQRVNVLLKMLDTTDPRQSALFRNVFGTFLTGRLLMSVLKQRDDLLFVESEEEETEPEPVFSLADLKHALEVLVRNKGFRCVPLLRNDDIRFLEDDPRRDHLTFPKHDGSGVAELPVRWGYDSIIVDFDRLPPDRVGLLHDARDFLLAVRVVPTTTWNDIFRQNDVYQKKGGEKRLSNFQNEYLPLPVQRKLDFPFLLFRGKGEDGSIGREMAPEVRAWCTLRSEVQDLLIQLINGLGGWSVVRAPSPSVRGAGLFYIRVGDPVKTVQANIPTGRSLLKNSCENIRNRIQKSLTKRSGLVRGILEDQVVFIDGLELDLTNRLDRLASKPSLKTLEILEKRLLQRPDFKDYSPVFPDLISDIILKKTANEKVAEPLIKSILKVLDAIHVGKFTKPVRGLKRVKTPSRPDLFRAVEKQQFVAAFRLLMVGDEEAIKKVLTFSSAPESARGKLQQDAWNQIRALRAQLVKQFPTLLDLFELAIPKVYIEQRLHHLYSRGEQVHVAIPVAVQFTVPNYKKFLRYYPFNEKELQALGIATEPLQCGIDWGVRTDLVAGLLDFENFTFSDFTGIKDVIIEEGHFLGNPDLWKKILAGRDAQAALQRTRGTRDPKLILQEFIPLKSDPFKSLPLLRLLRAYARSSFPNILRLLDLLTPTQFVALQEVVKRATWKLFDTPRKEDYRKIIQMKGMKVHSSNVIALFKDPKLLTLIPLLRILPAEDLTSLKNFLRAAPQEEICKANSWLPSFIASSSLEEFERFLACVKDFLKGSKVLTRAICRDRAHAATMTHLGQRRADQLGTHANVMVRHLTRACDQRGVPEIAVEALKGFHPKKRQGDRIFNFRHAHSPRAETYNRLEEVGRRRGRLFGRPGAPHTSRVPSPLLAQVYKETLKKTGTLAFATTAPTGKRTKSKWHDGFDVSKQYRRTGKDPKSPKSSTGEWYHHPELKRPIHADVNAEQNVALKNLYNRIRRQNTSSAP